MLNPIYTEETECQDCYKCIRHCPVKTIEVREGHAKILTEECILCGNCVRVCPVGAKKIRNDLSRAKRLIQSEGRTFLSLAPSFISEFPEYQPEQLIRAIKSLGFEGVSETALGAREVSAYTRKTLSKGGKGITISSACPTIVEYIKKYQPEYSRYISDILSPLQTHCLLLKKLYGEEIRIIFVGPCISKKREADLRPDLLNLAISFEDLREWFAEAGIDPSRIEIDEEDSFIPASSRSGAWYPSEGGMIKSIEEGGDEPLEAEMLSFSGIHAMEEILRGLDNAPETPPVFLELLACKGGCVNGPAANKSRGAAVKQCMVAHYAGRLSSVKDKPSLPIGEIENHWEITPVREPEFREKDIRTALRKIGKYGPEDEKNCGACGYPTCRDYAEAYLGNRAEKDMCVSYLKKLSEKKANALIKAIPSGVVIVDQELKIVECNKTFARLMGKETEEAYALRPGLKGAILEKILPYAAIFRGVLTGNEQFTRQTFPLGNSILEGSVFTIERNQVVGGIFQDVTSPQVQKERIIRQAKAVMEKNIEAVQKIAFLLGENAAESEVMLNTVIESFGPEKGSVGVVTQK